jgi:hypothetical protein
MARPLGHGRTLTKLQAARLFLDFLFDRLIVLHERAGDPRPAIDLTVIGYRGGPEGSAEYTPLLPGATAERYWLNLDELASALPSDRRHGPRRWIRAEPGGEPATASALDLAYQLVRYRLLCAPWEAPPVVVLCGDLNGRDEPAGRLARSLAQLASTAGSVQLFHVLFEEELAPSCWVPRAGEPWEGLWEAAAALPPKPGSDGPSKRRGLCVNTWPVRAVARAIVYRGADTVPGSASHAVAIGPNLAWFKTAKRGNEPHQWEDGFAEDLAAGRVAIADGASEGIFCKRWAALLARTFVEDESDLGVPATLNSWVEKCRNLWAAEIDVPHLAWSKQVKVARTGAAATFLGLELCVASEVEGDGNYSVAWRAWAVGDACLFILRSERIISSFPVMAAREFGPGPTLLRTLGAGGDPTPAQARGTCRPGDVLVLATDAVAEYLLQSAERGEGTSHVRLLAAGLDEDTWLAEIEGLRSRNQMVNDDCTLVLVRLAADPASVPAPDDLATTSAVVPSTEPGHESIGPFQDGPLVAADTEDAFAPPE